MRRTAVVVAALVLAGVAAVAVLVLRGGSSGLPRSEVASYLHAWEGFDAARMQRLVADPPPDFASVVGGMKRDLGVAKATFRTVSLRKSGDGADVVFSAQLELSGLGEWRYQGRLRFERRRGAWRLAWSPAALHPDLAPGQRFGRVRSWPARAPIVSADGSPLAGNGDVVVVGLEPDRVRDRAQVQAALMQQLGVDPAVVAGILDRPGVRPDAFLDVVTLAPDRYAQVRPALAPVPGVFFQRRTARRYPTDAFAAHLLGRVGAATAERLGQLGPPYISGDMTGVTGLEAVFERQLAGRPSGEVRVVDGSGQVVRVLERFAGADPTPLRTTLDASVQAAAEHALDGVAQPAAVVAIDATTGDLRAVVSRPLDQPFDRAVAGRYPPGSTFKVVTTAALLAAGTHPDTPVACPPQASVGGKQFTNFEGEAAPQIPFRTAFAQSCNTAFVTLANGLSNDALVRAAGSFGFGATYKLPVTVAGGQFPPPADTAERAAAAIGQGRVQTSPLHMATVAAAVASGTWRAPRLLADDPPGAATPLDPAVVGTLRDLMGEVVRSGTGVAAAVRGQQVQGKTGTAEFGPGNPPATHAWFIGFRGNLAFAVLVEGGGVGGRVAAPIAARFLTAVPG